MREMVRLSESDGVFETTRLTNGPQITDGEATLHALLHFQQIVNLTRTHSTSRVLLLALTMTLMGRSFALS